MKRSTVWVLVQLGLLLPMMARAAATGEFINFGFDDPDLSQASPYRPSWYLGETTYKWAPVGEALRGWQANYDLSFYSGRVNVESASTPLSLDPVGLGYRVYVGASQIPSTPLTPSVPRTEFSIYQTGRVPVDATHLNFYSYAALQGGETVPAQRALVYLDGVLQSPLEVGPSTYTVDVAKYAGQETEVKIVFPAARGYTFDIQGFTAVPEPSTYALMAMGTCALGWLVRRGEANR